MGSYDSGGQWHSEMEGFYNYHNMSSAYRPKSFSQNTGDGSGEGNGGGGGSIGVLTVGELLDAMTGGDSEYQSDFSKFDFSEYAGEDPPGNALSRFRERTSNWVQENIRGPLSGWFDTHTRNAFVLDAAGQARMDDLRGQMTDYMRDNVGGGIRWGAEHGLIGSGMGTGHIGAFSSKLSMENKIANFAKKAGIYSGQKSLSKNSKAIIEGYYQEMKAGEFTKRGAGFITTEGKIILTEGNHSMNAAIRYAIETGDISNIQIILKGNFTRNVNVKAYGIHVKNFLTK